VISWDQLHAYHGGLFSDHLWEEVKIVAEDLGRDLIKLVFASPVYRTGNIHRTELD